MSCHVRYIVGSTNRGGEGHEKLQRGSPRVGDFEQRFHARCVGSTKRVETLLEQRYITTAAITAKNEIKLRAGEFLPTRVMNLFFQLSSGPPESVLENLALLCFVPVSDVKNHFSEEKNKMEKDYENDVKRQCWKKHKLYEKKELKI